ncbi:cyclopropane-fatty-acyl-phospholipid synthase family protein [Candidatus Uabimicrobium sp. HlEnr_7]|uniref:SAM-dependent methyltransferase n=1 Tax=Candidatus Uabimicrobium helgolandensis TaxID=3095367 RepID=UPI00355716D1
MMKTGLSIHCLIRNSIICFTIFYLCTHSWSWPVFLLPFLVEITIEIFHNKGMIVLDPHSNKVINMYSFLDLIWPIAMGENKALTEGFYNNDKSKSLEQAQKEKYQWIIDHTDIKKGMQVLEIGCGNGDLLKYIKDFGCICEGITLSPEQMTLCQNMDIQVHNIDFFQLDKSFHNKYDLVICNGCLEHMPTVVTRKNPKKLYQDILDRIHLLLNKNSPVAKVMITCIHFRRPMITLSERFNSYIIERANGGWYPLEKDGLVKYSDKYSTKVIKDVTLDYHLTTQEWSKRASTKVWRWLPKYLLYMPIFLLNDPYYLHKIKEKTKIPFLNKHGSWGWQFAGKNPPMLPQWIVLQDKNINDKKCLTNTSHSSLNERNISAVAKV